MKKVGLILLAFLAVASCDLLYHKDAENFVPANDIQLSAIQTVTAAKQGEVVTVWITVKNAGLSDVEEPIEVNLWDKAEGRAVSIKKIDKGLARDDSTTFSYNWDTEGLALGEHTIVAEHNYSDENPSNDTLSTNLWVSEPDITDIAITAIRIPETVLEGEVVDVEVVVKNIGNQNVNDAIPIFLEDRTSGSTLGTENIEEGLAMGDSSKINFSWNTGGNTIELHEVTAAHNFQDENPANNVRSKMVMVAEAPIPDIAIVAMEMPSEAIQGEDVEVSVTLRNVGQKEVEKNFKVMLTDKTENLEIAVKTITGGLAVGNSVVVTFVWDTQGAGIGTHNLKSHHDFEDENTSNDSRTSEIMINEVPVTDIALTEFNGPESVIQGETVSLSLRIENLGNQDVNSEIKVTLSDQTDGKDIATKSITKGLLEGNATSLDFTWKVGNASIGNHRLSVTHNLSDDDNINNSAELTVFVDEPPFIDLALLSMSVASSATQGDQVAVSVRIENRGNRDVTQDVTVNLTDDTDQNVIRTWVLTGGLQEGETAVLNHNWDTGTASVGDHKLIATHNLDDDKSDNDSQNAMVSVNEPIFLDIGITDVNAPIAVNLGTVVTIEVTIKNLGNRDINDAITVTIIDQTSGNTLGTQILAGGMVRDATVSLGFVWGTKIATPGNHRLVVSHNYSDDNAFNNSQSLDINLLE